MHLMCSPLEIKEKAHADNCGFRACSPTCGHFPTLLLFPDNGKPGGHINSPAGLVPRNALVSWSSSDSAIRLQILCSPRFIGLSFASSNICVRINLAWAHEFLLAVY